MKRFFLISVAMIAVLGLFFLPYAPSSFAQARYTIGVSRPLTSNGLFVDADDNTMDYAVWIYGLTIYAGSTNVAANIKNADTTAELLHTSTVYPKDEIGEPTQYETTTHNYIEMYGKPMYFSEGVGGCLTGTSPVLILAYGPEPE